MVFKLESQLHMVLDNMPETVGEKVRLALDVQFAMDDLARLLIIVLSQAVATPLNQN